MVPLTTWCASGCAHLRKLLDCNLLKLTILWSRLHVFSTFSLLQHGNASTRTYIDTAVTTSAYSSAVCKYKEPQHCLSSIKFPKTQFISLWFGQTDNLKVLFRNSILTCIFYIQVRILYVQNCRMHEMCGSYFFAHLRSESLCRVTVKKQQRKASDVIISIKRC